MNDIKNNVNVMYKKIAYLNLCVERRKYNKDKFLSEISQIILLAQSVQEKIKINNKI